MFIVIEGIDGSGKTTQTKRLGEYLESKTNKEVVITREPAGTALGADIKELILHSQISLKTQMFLMWAARIDHLEQVIVPALERNAFVVCDRFSPSTFAYQGTDELLEPMLNTESMVCGVTQPDIYIWLKLEAHELEHRLGRRPNVDSLDSYALKNHLEVQKRYETFFLNSTVPTAEIDGAQGEDKVFAQIQEAVDGKLE
jgi:dTMP kinase